VVADTGLYLGLISGTSMDAVDAALLRFEDDSARLLATRAHPLPADLQDSLRVLARSRHTSIEALGELDHRTGSLFAEAALALLSESGHRASEVRAIGSHGQTVRHRPAGLHPFTLQIGDANLIAERTGITTVADFRRRDMAAGGQGAPLVPPFHAWLLRRRPGRHAVLNLGGIANLSLIEDGRLAGGFDTGPASTLLDAWTGRHLGERWDAEGRWASGGHTDPELLSRLLQEPYLSLPPPKSTGFELFNLDWLEPLLDLGRSLAPRDVMSTLAQFTVETVAGALERHWPGCLQLWVCGGGVRNTDLMARLGRRLPGITVADCAALGIGADWMEAAAFAWLASRRLKGLPGNAPVVTGARHEVVLGAVYS
jgi:anhydro-N-acetylmuramic acid kinase